MLDGSALEEVVKTVVKPLMADVNWSQGTRNSMFRQIEQCARDLYAQQGNTLFPDAGETTESTTRKPKLKARQTTQDQWTIRVLPEQFELGLGSGERFLANIWVESMCPVGPENPDGGYSGGFGIDEKQTKVSPRIWFEPSSRALKIDYRMSNRVVAPTRGPEAEVKWDSTGLLSQAYKMRLARLVTDKLLSQMGDKLGQVMTIWASQASQNLRSRHGTETPDRASLAAPGTHNDAEAEMSSSSVAASDRARSDAIELDAPEHGDVREQMTELFRKSHEFLVRCDPRDDIEPDKDRTAPSTFEPVSYTRHLEPEEFGPVSRICVNIVPRSDGH